MVAVRLFGQIRVAAGRSRDEIPASQLEELLASMEDRYGPEFSALVGTCAIFVNGERATPGQGLSPDDEVALLPPVSGGSGASSGRA